MQPNLGECQASQMSSLKQNNFLEDILEQAGYVLRWQWENNKNNKDQCQRIFFQKS